MSEMYTKHAKKYGEVVKDNIYNALLERPSTQALLDDVKGKKVIDMGCGSGIYTQWLVENQAQSVISIDLSHDMVDMVNQCQYPNVTAYQQDMTLGLPKEADNSADVIICPLMIHYIEDLVPLFAEVHRVLKSGGYMVFSTHHPFADFECSLTGNYFDRELIKEQWDTVGTPVEVQFYRRSLTELSNAITSTGLAITNISEGKVDEKVKEISPERYDYLTKNPNFIFMRVEKR